MPRYLSIPQRQGSVACNAVTNAGFFAEDSMTNEEGSLSRPAVTSNPRSFVSPSLIDLRITLSRAWLAVHNIGRL